MPRLTGWDLLLIHRLEFPLALTYLCYAAWGAGYAASTSARPADVALAVVGNGFLIVAALAMNTAADVRTDVRDADKGGLTGAVLRFGHRRVLLLAGAEALAGLACAIVLAVRTGRWVLPAIAVASIGSHLLYNVEPLRLKRRGFAGSAVFGLGLVGMPFLLANLAVAPGLSGAALPVFAGVTVLAIGRAAWWSVPDRAVDTAAGVGTPAVRHGARRALWLACLVMLTGLLLVVTGLSGSLGAVWVVPGTAAHAAFLAVTVALLRRNRLPGAAHRRRATGLVVTGEVGLAVLPLVAPA